MLLKRGICIGLLAFASLALAQQDVQHRVRKLLPQQPTAENVPSTGAKDFNQANAPRELGGNARLVAEPAGDLIPRNPLPKPEQVVKPVAASGKLIVKFMDRVKARSRDNARVVSLAGANITGIEQLANDLGLRFVPALGQTEDKLAQLELRAAAHSGKAQADLAGIMYVEGPAEALEQAAQILSEMNIVEYVEFELQRELDYGSTGGCCLPDGSCAAMSEADCTAAGGSYLGDDVLCPDPADPCGACAGSCFRPGGNGTPGCYNESAPTCCADVCNLEPDCCDVEWDAFCVEIAEVFCEACGHPDAESCFESNNTPFCNIEDCCNTVCAIEPLCCDPDEQWDDVCAAIAGLFCEGCNANAGDCYEPNGTPGCDDPDCCDLVCAIDPDCCDQEWDADCAQIAQFGCEAPTGCPSVGSCLDEHTTPGCDNATCCELVCTAEPLCCDLAWDGTCVSLAVELCQSDDTGPTPDFTSLQGYRRITTGGFDLEGEDPLDPYDGLYGLGQWVLEVEGLGEQNQARGATINVGVVEFSAYIAHEDLDVNLDPEMTPDDLFTLSTPYLNHGTATLGEIVALENSFGCTGIAPDAQGWFFPITTSNQGGRELAAWTNALLEFGPGDVLSASYGPGGCGTLASGATMWTLFRLASDLGITVCISAGNDCCNLETAPQFDGEDSGVIIVGAGFAGYPWCRLGFSNFHESPNSPNETEQVHVQAWGTAITTLGYGDLFLGDSDPNRAYTQGFGGTSGAAPMIAGLVANLQGLSKQYYGIALMPEQIRSLITGCPGPTVPQCVVPFCDESLLPGEPDVDPPTPCVGDLDPEGDPNVIGPFPRAYGCGTSLISGGWFGGAALIDDITILRGNLIYGNLFSIKASDNNYLVIESQYTTPGTKLGGVSGPENPQYTGYGEITDLLFGAHADLPGANAMLIEVESRVSDGMGLMFVELWHWEFNRYVFAGFGVLGGVDALFEFPVAGATRYIRESDQRVLIRIWTLSPGGNTVPGLGMPSNTYRVFHDWVNLTLGEDFGDIFSPTP